MSQQTDTTVVIVPRESFNKTVDVVKRILEVTHDSFKMLIMEGHAPDSVRRKLRAIEARNPNCRIVWSDKWIFAHEAANQAMTLVDTEFIVYIDNDVEVMEGWLENLVACAKEKDAACVHPIYLTTNLQDPDLRIHVAEGKYVIEERDGGERYLDTIMTYSGVPLRDYPDRERKSSDFFEWHCVLFRKSLLDKVGPLDDMNIAEHVDYSLRVQQAGETIWLEPKAVVAYEYERIFKFRGADRAYFLYRWDVEKARRSLERLRDKWNLSEDSIVRRFYWVNEHTGRVRNTALIPRIINRMRRLAGLPNLPYTRLPRPITAADRVVK
jgi:GT2 family glycosyltransferase